MLHKNTFNHSSNSKKSNENKGDTSLLQTAQTHMTQNNSSESHNINSPVLLYKCSSILEPKAVNKNSNNALMETQAKFNDSFRHIYQTPVKEYKNDLLVIERKEATTKDEVLFESFSKKKTNQTFKEYEEDKPKDKEKENSDVIITEYEKLINHQQINLPIPIEKKDDEKYKLLKIQQMKKKTVSAFKSDKKAKEFNHIYQQEKLNSFNEYALLKKKKMVHSAMKTYTSFITLYLNDKEIKFPIFVDKEIGIYEYWQEQIVESVRFLIIIS